MWDDCKEICGDGFDWGTYECDDGNRNTGDGCNQNCKVEKGFFCDRKDPDPVGSTINNPDVCYEICGDGRDFGFYECDDGNLINGDGCNDLCEIEPGYECKDGNRDNKDTCVEICNDL